MKYILTLAALAAAPVLAQDGRLNLPAPKDPIPACIKSVAIKTEALIFYCPGWKLIAMRSWKPTPTPEMANDPAALRVLSEIEGHAQIPANLVAEAEALAR